MFNTKINKGNKTAKLDRELFFQISKGNVRISSNAINFMTYVIKYVAKDGRIYCNLDELNKSLFMQKKTLNRVINELISLNLLSEKEGFLYSHFHVLSNGDKEDKGYIRNIKALTSNEFLALDKKKKRFFLYVASFARMGAPKSVSVEALYSNKYHSGVNYIESYQELAEILFEFVQKGYFVVYINGKRYDNTTNDFQHKFHAYCGYNPTTGKKRMSLKRTHKIALAIHDRLLKDVINNESSKEEIKYYANEYNIYHEVMRQETIPFIISIQNDLFERFSSAGLELYRHALETYFSTEQENVLYHDLLAKEDETKAANTMMDFYLLKEVQQIIVKVLKEKTNLNDLESYFAKENHLSNLIQYFIEKSSDNHKILLDAELEKHGLTLDRAINNVTKESFIEESLSLLNRHVTDIYKQFNFDSESTSLTAIQQKEIIRNWAVDGILAVKDSLKQAVNELRKKVLFRANRQVYQIGYTKSSKKKSTPKVNSYASKRREQRNKQIEEFRELSKTWNIADLQFDF